MGRARGKLQRELLGSALVVHPPHLLDALGHVEVDYGDIRHLGSGSSNGVCTSRTGPDRGHTCPFSAIPFMLRFGMQTLLNAACLTPAWRPHECRATNPRANSSETTYSDERKSVVRCMESSRSQPRPPSREADVQVPTPTWPPFDPPHPSLLDARLPPSSRATMNLEGADLPSGNTLRNHSKLSPSLWDLTGIRQTTTELGEGRTPCTCRWVTLCIASP